MNPFTILLGGDLVPTSAVASEVAGTRIIAADAGMRHAESLAVVPELWVGDFDSEPEFLPSHLANIARLRFSHEKDKTDGELAIDIALSRGATSLLLVGAFGGTRGDHEFLHLSLGLRLAEKGMPVKLTSGTQDGYPLLPGDTEFDFPHGTLFSILAFSDLSRTVGEGRQVASGHGRGRVRLVADAFQRNTGSARHHARRRPRHAGRASDAPKHFPQGLTWLLPCLPLTA